MRFLDYIISLAMSYYVFVSIAKFGRFLLGKMVHNIELYKDFFIWLNKVLQILIILDIIVYLFFGTPYKIMPVCCVATYIPSGS